MQGEETGGDMCNKSPGRDVTWMVATVLAGIAVLTVGVLLLQNVFVTFVGLGITATSLVVLWLRR